ncbi:maleylpyruvate isomerase family mycothiol-dependent enzyme [Streptomyces sp. NPDC020742]|uniref:maleylpyruvate isomerase family mycothiol-dependent enzyme n=1 Tax=Streptomyces sp. NPDC020742 TaxID=3154897 RepID=UPI0033F8EB9A
MAVTTDGTTPQGATPAGAPPAGSVRAAVGAGQERLRALLPDLTEAAVREPSALPGWSRAHVLAHLEGIGLALARQARTALRGELVELYDGGRPERAAGIETGARRPAGALGDAVAAALDEAAAAWAAVGPADWSRPVRYRDGTLLTALLSWWRELEIHTADARLGPGPQDWSRELCGHLMEHLAPRVPRTARLVLAATDAEFRREYGGTTGPEATVRGRLTDLTAWVAGRAPRGPLDCRRAGASAPLPELLDWP